MTRDFAELEGKRSQWAGFLRRLPGTSAPTDLATVIDTLSAFAGPVLIAVGRGETFDRTWLAGGPWR